jgi:hypothetical protein
MMTTRILFAGYDASDDLNLRVTNVVDGSFASV